MITLFLVGGGLLALALLSGGSSSPAPSPGPSPVPGPKPAPSPAPSVKPSGPSEAEIKAYGDAVEAIRRDGFNRGKGDGYEDAREGVYNPNPDARGYVGSAWNLDAKAAYRSGYSAGYNEGRAEYEHDAAASVGA